MIKMIAVSSELIQRLKDLAKRKTWEDDVPDGESVNPMDYSGGNYDDAYAGGERVGATELARSVLDELGIEYRS
jgi:hypothetical protein